MAGEDRFLIITKQKTGVDRHGRVVMKNCTRTAAKKYVHDWNTETVECHAKNSVTGELITIDSIEAERMARTKAQCKRNISPARMSAKGMPVEKVKECAYHIGLKYGYSVDVWELSQDGHKITIDTNNPLQPKVYADYLNGMVSRFFIQTVSHGDKDFYELQVIIGYMQKAVGLAMQLTELFKGPILY